MNRAFAVLLVPAVLICGLAACSTPAPTATAPFPGLPTITRPAFTVSGAVGTVGTVGTAGTADTAGASPAAGSTCTLVTLAEVSTATTTTMKLTADEGALGECVYSAVDDASNLLYLSVDASSDDITQRKLQLESLSTHLSGMGDDAFWNSTLGEVFVQKGARALIIIQPSLANITATPTANKARMVALATAALGRW